MKEYPPIHERKVPDEPAWREWCSFACDMAHRSFTDRDGTRWKVSVVEPEVASQGRERRGEPRRPAAAARPKTPQLATRPITIPWLCFQSKSTRLRLSPVPSTWAAMTDVELEDLMADAKRAE